MNLKLIYTNPEGKEKKIVCRPLTGSFGLRLKVVEEDRLLREQAAAIDDEYTKKFQECEGDKKKLAETEYQYDVTLVRFKMESDLRRFRLVLNKKELTQEELELIESPCDSPFWTDANAEGVSEFIKSFRGSNGLR